MKHTASKYWGWGAAEKSFDPVKRDRLLEILAKDHKLVADKISRPLPQDDIDVPASKLPRAFINAWKSRGLAMDKTARLVHAAGKSYRDLVRLRSGRGIRFPDGVLRLKSAEDLPDLFCDAAKHGIVIVPFGGGTGVVGGTECVGPQDYPILIVDLKSLDHLLALDDVSLTVTFEAGILGPKLEAILNERGYTLGHFPQSFEFSTLGGWVATRSAGQNSTRYGKIEDMVRSLTICTPAGTIATHDVPASATGPSLKELLIGSEGVYGIITAATLKIARLPEVREFAAAYFRSFEDGMTCVRAMIQAGIRPAVLRLMDAGETAITTKLSMHSTLAKIIGPLWFSFQRLGESPSFLLLSFEGSNAETKFAKREAVRFIAKSGGSSVQRSLGDKWRRERFELPYLRDDLMDRGYFIDTLETAAPWSKLPALHAAMSAAFSKENCGESLVVGAHLSHAYPDGASLYFTFIGKRKAGGEIAQWERIKSLATDTIVAHSGALSHHHGIGYDHKRWMDKELGALGIDVLRAIKSDLDPDGLLNPGKVF